MTTRSADDTGSADDTRSAVAGVALLAPLSWAQGVSACLLAYFTLRAALIAVTALSGGGGVQLSLLGGVDLLVFGGGAWLLLRAEPRTKASPRRLWAAAGLRRAPLMTLLCGAAAGFFAKAPADALRSSVETFFPTPPAELAARQVLLTASSMPEMVLALGVIGLVGPACEELFYRGPLFVRLTAGTGPIAAALITGAAFTLGHADVRDAPSLALVTALLTWLRFFSGGVATPVAAHATFNCASLTFAWLADPKCAWATLVGRHPAAWVAFSLVALALMILTLVRHGVAREGDGGSNSG